MKNRVFADSDIILDVIFKRDPFFSDSQKILALCESNVLEGYTSSLIIANCYYIIHSNINQLTARKTIGKLREIFNVLPLTNKEIGESLNSQFKDFEDGIEYYIASNYNIRTIITRNINDYKNADIIALTPAHFLTSMLLSQK